MKSRLKILNKIKDNLRMQFEGSKMDLRLLNRKLISARDGQQDQIGNSIKGMKAKIEDIEVLLEFADEEIKKEEEKET